MATIPEGSAEPTSVELRRFRPRIEEAANRLEGAAEAARRLAPLRSDDVHLFARQAEDAVAEALHALRALCRQSDVEEPIGLSSVEDYDAAVEIVLDQVRASQSLRWRRLLRSLQTGRVRHWDVSFSEELLERQLAAVVELEARLGAGGLPPFPGDGDADDWLCGLVEGGRAARQATIRALQAADFARLARFLLDLAQVDAWIPGGTPPAPSQDADDAHAQDARDAVAEIQDEAQGSPETPGLDEAESAVEIAAEIAARPWADARPPTALSKEGDAEHSVEVRDWKAASAVVVAQSTAVAAKDDSELPTVPLAKRTNDEVSGHGALERSAIGPGGRGKARPAECGSAGAHSEQGPEHLPSYDEFLDRNWIDAHDQLAAAPWVSKDFTADLAAQLEESLRALDGFRAASFALVAHEADRARPAPEIVLAAVAAAAGQWEWAAELMCTPPDSQRSAHEWGLALALHAAGCADPQAPSTSVELDNALERARIRTPNLRTALESLIQARMFGFDPATMLEAPLGPDSQVSRLAMFEDARSAIRIGFNSLRRDFFKQIPRKHCRHAWSEYLEVVSPEVNKIMSFSGPRSVDVDALSRLATSLLEQHAEIADRHNARYEDRAAMDRKAAAFAGSITRFAQAARGAAGPQQVNANLPVLAPEAVAWLRSAEGLTDPWENLGRLVLRAWATQTPNVQACAAPTGRHVARWPGLLGLPTLHFALPLERKTDAQNWFALLRRATPLETRTLAALLVDLPAPDNLAGPRTADQGHLVEDLRNLGRYDLLEGFGSSRLKQSDLDRLQHERLQRRTDIETQRSRLASLRVKLVALAEPLANRVDALLEEVDTKLGVDRIGHLRMVFEWLSVVARQVEVAAELRIRLLRHEGESLTDPTRNRGLLAALDNGNWADAVRLRRPDEALAETSRRNQRFLRWRDDPDPPAALDLVRLPKEISELWAKWNEPNVTIARYGGLKRVFRKALFGQAAPAEPAAATEVDVASEILAKLEPEDYPTWMPQVANMGRIRIVAADAPVTGTHFVAKAVEVAGNSSIDAAIVLAPGLAKEKRQATIEEFRRLRRLACVVDTADMTRIIVAAGTHKAQLCVLELLLEQAAWQLTQPFSGGAGPRTEPAMFVGRADEARNIAMKHAYSLLFSGRKLGKTALLNFVQRRYDGHHLPSNNTLKVIYASIAGLDQEGAVIDAIRREVEQRTGFAADLAKTLPPQEAFVAWCRTFCTQKPTTSLLVVLDEADIFVEKEIERYERGDRERCLSFKMRSDVEDSQDSRNLPRIRFLFSGYRATNTRSGAWANWNDVLLLQPLERAEAGQLIAGPLARLGVDAIDVADSIAYRCGNQPAVLLSFGAELFRQLVSGAAQPVDQRSVIRPERVDRIFESPSIRSEIRQIAKNNFQGDLFGEVVFAALLHEIATQPWGRSIPLDDAAERVCDRVSAVLGPVEVGFEDRVRHHLRTLLERNLLRSEDEVGTRYIHLRFAHHLPALLEEWPDQTVVAKIRQLGASSVGKESKSRSLLGRSQMEAIRYVLDSSEPMFAAAVVADAWTEVLTTGDAARHATILDRCGFWRMGDEVVDAAQEALNPAHVQSDRLVVVNCSPEFAAGLVPQRRTGKVRRPLLMGGLDLLRWAIEEGHKPDGLVEVCGLRRFSPETMAWWFGDAQGCEAEVAALDKIMRLSSGIPVLCGAIYRRLFSQSRENLTVQDVAAVEAEMPVIQAELANELLAGAPAQRLVPREFELLRILAEASRVGEGYGGVAEPRELEDLLDVDDIRDFCRKNGIRPLSNELEDSVHLKLLRECGLALSGSPTAAIVELHRIRLFGSGDPVLALVERMAAGGTV